MKFIKHMWCAIGRLSKSPHVYEAEGAARMAAEAPAFPVVVVDKASYDEMVLLIKELDEHEGAEGWSRGIKERVNAVLKENT